MVSFHRSVEFRELYGKINLLRNALTINVKYISKFGYVKLPKKLHGIGG